MSNILLSRGNATQKRVINLVNQQVGREFSSLTNEVFTTYGFRMFPVRWVAGAPESFSKAGITINSRLTPAQAVEALKRVLNQIKAYLTQAAPTPAPSNVTPVTPKPETPEPEVWFVTEDNNLFHRATHSGPEPAEFFAVRSDAINAGYVADGECNA